MKTTTFSALAALALPLVMSAAQADITQDCILEGKVDKRKATQVGGDVYVRFRSAEDGEEANCDMARRSGRHRVQFKAPSTDDIADAPHGARVKYRYIERNDADGQWELIESSHERF